MAQHLVASRPESTQLGEQLSLYPSPSDTLARLSTLTVDEINDHLIRTHLLQPEFLRLRGFRFDAELSSYFGLSLDETVRASFTVLRAIGAGSLSSLGLSTQLRPDLVSAVEQAPGDDPYLERGALTYRTCIEAELGGLASRGVVSNEMAEIINTTVVNPGAVSTYDSFFRRFDLPQ